MILPKAGFGNKIPLLLPQDLSPSAAAKTAALLAANLNSFALDFVMRQKLQGQTINLFILEQMPTIRPERFEESIGGIKISDFVCDQVLHLSYTAHDLGDFASDSGYVAQDGSVKPPFRWDDEDRRFRMAALDALFMHLYGIEIADAKYILDTFPIIRDQDVSSYGRYLSSDLICEYMKDISDGRMPVLMS